jgi:thiamine kinase-like enzyme
VTDRDVLDRDVLERLAPLAGRSWRVERLSGGLSNATWRARTDDGPPPLDLVVRRWPEDDARDHDVEVAAATAAAAVGAGPAVAAYDPGLRAVALDHVAGRALTAEDLHDDAVLTRVVATLLRLHTARADLPRLDLLALADVPDAVADALAQGPEPLVLCHNDLVPANLVDDGERVTLIDFEYAGLGEPSLELAGLAVGAGFDRDRVTRLVELYDGTVSPRRLERVRHWQVVTGVVWARWADARGHAAWARDLRGRVQELLRG